MFGDADKLNQQVLAVANTHICPSSTFLFLVSLTPLIFSVGYWPLMHYWHSAHTTLSMLLWAHQVEGLGLGRLVGLLFASLSQLYSPLSFLFCLCIVLHMLHVA